MSNIALSILIPSVHTRRKTHLPNMVERVYSLYEALTPVDQEKVEILVLVDNKKMMLGEKRNEMVRMAQGEYVVFVDDDDRIEDDYITALLEAVWSSPDVVTFQVSVSLNSQAPKICHYSKDYAEDYNEPETYHRLPNHICCVKRELASKVSYPSVAYGEDSVYAKLLKPLLQTQEVIPKVLYHYDYSDIGTETQQHLTNRKARIRANDETLVDVVILSNADSVGKQLMTQKTIDSILTGANGLPVKVFVIEQQQVTYANAKTIAAGNKPFNYNEFMNDGAAHGSSPWILFCNNDLEAQDAFLHHLLAANHPVVSPKCPVDGRQTFVTENSKGYVNGVFFSGWCFMMKRDVFNAIGGLDTCVNFWCSDDVTIEQIKAIGIEPMLVPAAKVKHLGSTTLLGLPQEQRDELCWGQVDIFNEKYGQNKFSENDNYKAWKARK